MPGEIPGKSKNVKHERAWKMATFATKMVAMGWERDEAIIEIADIDRVSKEEAGRRYDTAVKISGHKRKAGFKRGILAEQAKIDAGKNFFNKEFGKKYKSYYNAWRNAKKAK